MNGVSRIKRTEGLATDDFTWDGENRLVAVSKATPGTPYAYQGSLTSNGQGAISVSSYFTYAGPALKVGQVVTLSGAPLAQLNGAHTITSVWGSGSFSYQVPGTQSGGPVGVLVTVDQLNQQQSYQFGYDYRSRRVNLTTPTAPFTQVVFSGGTSVREIENGVATVDYVRGSDWGGGVGGILYTLRAGVPSFTHYNRRGDVTAKTDGTGKITYQAKYEAFGKRTSETGATLNRQKSNTKDEDIPGYANEGFRFRDLETGTFISKDPAGLVDGPNVYAYVVQNPWTSFDPEGLKVKVTTKENRDDKGNKVKETRIVLTGKVVFGGESAKLSKKEQEKVVAKIVRGLKDVYCKTDKKDHKLSIEVNLSIANLKQEISKDDHVISIVDNVAKDPAVAGAGWTPGKHFALDKDFIGRSDFGNKAAHEFGHNLGLMHANATDLNNTTKDRETMFGIDRKNQNPINDLEPTNVMRYRGGQSTVNSKQIMSIDEKNSNDQPNDSPLGTFDN